MKHFCRLDRFLTLYFFYPFLKLKPKREGPRIAILMYHSISEPEKDKNVHPYYEICTSPKLFAEHMQILYNNNYSIITLEEAINILKLKENSTDQIESLTQQSNELKRSDKFYVVLTFDDGYRDFYTKAFPILKRYSFPATVFLPTGFIGSQPMKFNGKECLTWKEVRELCENGISFGSHTITHSKLIEMGKKKIEYELKGSKEELENRIKRQVRAFCYPYAFPEQDKKFVAMLLSLLEECGYSIGVTTRVGLVAKLKNIFTLKRIPINDLDDMAFFMAKLTGAYDWIQKFQYVSKKIKKYNQSESLKE